ncbi:LysR family transcriptional regulator [Inquilinus sp. OTU3971]|uniref:LysR family transcriptional regulator n=1 Tax=Inquilinus sp. OTU3971 TaxID=3043855 RepID=UPI00313E23E3
MPRFDWNDLRHFLAVARAGTVSSAARHMGVDHATVIRRVDALEQGLGSRLFERNPRGYNLTQGGERLLAHAEAIEAEAREAERTLGASARDLAGVVRVTVLEGFGSFFLAGRLPRFAAQHPKLRVDVLTIQQIVALSRREADIDVSLHAPASGRYLREHLTDYTLHIYAHQDYLKGVARIIDASELRAHPFIGYVDDLVFIRALDYAGELGGPRPRLQYSSLQAQLEAVCAGFGLCVLPDFVAARRPGLMPVLPDEVVLRRSYWLVAAESVAASPRVRSVIGFIRAEARAARALFLPSARRDP